MTNIRRCKLVCKVFRLHGCCGGWATSCRAMCSRFVFRKSLCDLEIVVSGLDNICMSSCMIVNAPTKQGKVLVRGKVV